MQQNIQIYIDAYSNFILNHLLLAENVTGINVIQLTPTPTCQTFPTPSNGLLYTDLKDVFEGYTPIKLGDLSLAPTYEISLYFLCKEPKFSTMSAKVFFESYYQLTGEEYVIMTLHSQDTPITTSKLEASSLITCSLNLSLNHDYELYKVATKLIREMVIRFYSPKLTKMLEKQSTSPDSYPRKGLDAPKTTTTLGIIENPNELLSAEELEALSHILKGLPDSDSSEDTDSKDIASEKTDSHTDEMNP